MKYVIVTTQWCIEHGIVVPVNARKSVDGKLVLLHDIFIRPVVGTDEEINYYEYNSSALESILNSEKWTIKQ